MISVSDAVSEEELKVGRELDGKRMVIVTGKCSGQ